MEPEASAEVTPRPAATVLALRRHGDPFEVLMVRRAREARFMGGARVFPGGAVDAADAGADAAAVVVWSGDPEERPWRAAALRELAEEAGIVVDATGRVLAPDSGGDLYGHLAATGSRLDADALAYVSNWVTPRGLPKRFDTRFYLLELPLGAVARADRTEVYDPVWVSPRDALAASGTDWQVEPPTRVHLEMLAATPDLDTALAAAFAARPVRIEPRLWRDAAGVWTVLLPGDPGFEEAG